MNASRSTDWLVICAAGAAIAGLAAGVPLLSAVATMTAWIAVSGRSTASAQAITRSRNPHRRWRGPDRGNAASLCAFQTGAGGSFDHEEDLASNPPSDNGDGGSAAFEEFTAGLEEDDGEEISFLPPYVSGSQPHDEEEDETPIDEDWEPHRPHAGDPALLKDLPDLVESRSKMPVPRRFALGTVAVLRNLLSPEDVETILVEQRRYPALRFGDAAVQLGLLSEEQRNELVRAQQDGVFTDDEIRRAKSRLELYARS